MKKHINKIIAVVIIGVVLAFAFLWSGNTPSNSSLDLQQNQSQTYTQSDSIQNETKTEIQNHETAVDAFVSKQQEQTENKQSNVQRVESDHSPKNETDIDDNTQKDKYQTEPVMEGKPVPVEPENSVVSDEALTCTLSVRCDTVLKNIERLDKEKSELVPKDGVIYAEQTVTFYEGESVFDVLVREMKRNKIHLEFENTPIYNSAYIEGIGNLYEFDCGELSGWMYKVNDWFPNYGCSRYQLKAGDKVEWIYTCDLGADIGGDYSERNGK